MTLSSPDLASLRPALDNLAGEVAVLIQLLEEIRVLQIRKQIRNLCVACVECAAVEEEPRDWEMVEPTLGICPPCQPRSQMKLFQEPEPLPSDV